MGKTSKEKLTQDWTESINGQLTFAGVLMKYYDTVAEHWNDDTRNIYMRHYNDYLLGQFEEKPLADYTREDYDKAIEQVQLLLQKKGRKSHADILQHYRLLIRRVTKTAQREGICSDILWGTVYSESKTNEKSEDVVRKRQRRSLSEREEIAIFNAIMQEPEQDGEKMGLALMFALGLRNAEACAVDFGDVKPMELYPMCYCVRVYKTTRRNSSERQDSGKTKNAVRMIPVPDALVKLIMERRRVIEEAYRRGEWKTECLSEESLQSEIDCLPIACVGRDYTQGCSSHNLTMAAQKLFQSDVRLDESIMYQIDSDLHMKENRENAFLEKEPTAYLFRRNFGTWLYRLGLEEPEIQYIIGHDIEAEQETRAGYRNEEKLYPIWQKLSRRFLLNPVDTEELTATEDYISRENVTQLKVTIPVPSGKTARKRIIIYSTDADSGLQVRAKVVGGITATAEIRQRPNSRKTRREANVVEIMKLRFKSAMKSGEESPDDEEPEDV